MVRKAEQALPNQQLRLARKQRGWTQQEVADGIGAPLALNVMRWERGMTRPSAHYVQRLCQLFDKSAVELGLLVEEDSLQEEPVYDGHPLWHLPLRRNPFFTGREEILRSLHKQLAVQHTLTITQSHALCGLGGIGKTHLALEYAYRHGAEYSAVFWITAENVETILSSFEAIADLLRLPEREEANQQRMVQAVRRWLGTHSRWLLIWDNLEAPVLLERFLPPAHTGAVLITTRRQALGTLAQGVELPSLNEEEGIVFLLRRAKQLEPIASIDVLQSVAQSRPTEYVAARELVVRMGGLPLALDQVGAYVEETPCTLVDYLQLYERRRAALLRRRGDVVFDHPDSVATTWSLSFERVEQANPDAAELLRWCAFLHPDAIPEELFVTTSTKQEQQRGGLVMADVFALHEAIRTATAYSLLKRNIEEQTLSLHRLVQAVLLEGMGQQERADWQKRVIRRLDALFPAEVIYEVWPRCERLLPHVLVVAMAVTEHAEEQELAEVLCRAADYLRKRVQFKQAEPLYQRALRIWEQTLGLEHPTVAVPLSGLARLYYEQGKYEQAEPLFLRALQILEQTLGPEHPDVAYPSHGLADLYRKQGKYRQAESLFLRSLRIMEQTLGPEHPEVAYPLEGLAELYLRQSKYEQAESLSLRSLRIREQAWGPGHPEVTYPLNNLAILYLEQSKYEQAEPLYQRALHILEQKLGSEHPKVAYPLNNLAGLYLEQSKYGQAEPLYQRALHILEQSLGPEHPEVAYPLEGLAELYLKQGKYEQAEPLYRRALHIDEQVHGPEHPTVAYPLKGLADLYREQGKYKQAEPLYQRALRIRQQHLGQQHPDTARSMAGLAMLYQKQGRDEQAEALLHQACSIFEQRLGQAHPETRKALDCHRTLRGQRDEQNRSVQNRSVQNRSVQNRHTGTMCHDGILQVYGPTLVAAFALLSDHRAPQSRRHPLSAVLALATAAMLAGARSLYAIAAWGRSQPEEVTAALGFSSSRTPARSSLHEVFHRLDTAAFEQALSTWARQNLAASQQAIEQQDPGLFGLHGEELPGVRLLAAYQPHARLVVVSED